MQAFIKKIKANYGHDLLGILLTGSLSKKILSKNSDIDLFILVKDRGKRIRGIEIVNGIEVEYFINPPKQLESDMERERAQQKKITLNIFKDGKILYDKNGSLKKLQKKALLILNEKSDVSEFNIFSFKYFISDYLKDIDDDLSNKDYIALEYDINLLTLHILEGFCKIKKWPLRKPKYMREDLLKKDRQFARLFENLAKAKRTGGKIRALHRLAKYVLERSGGGLEKTYEIKSQTTY